MKHLHLDNVDDLLNNADKPKLIESQIIEYIVMLKNPPHSLAYQSRNLYLAAFLTFYSMNDITLNKRKISKYLGERVKAHKDRHYSIEEIEKLLHFCDDRLKAIVLLLACCHCR